MADAGFGDAARLQPLALVNLFTVYVVWGSTFLAMRVGVRPGSGFDPWLFGGTRILVAAVLLFVIAVLLGRRLLPDTADVPGLVVSGILIWVGGHGLFLWAEQWADSGYTSLFVASFLMWSALFDAVLDRQAPHLATVIWILVGFAGVAVLVVPHAGASGANPPAALVALVVAPVAWTAGFTVQKRRVHTTGAFVGSAWQHLASAPVFLALAWLTGESRPHPSPDAWLAWGYLVVFGSVVAFTAAHHAMRHLPARIAFTYSYVNPVIAVILGHVILNEAVDATLVAGAALVLLGVFGVFRERVRPATRGL